MAKKKKKAATKKSAGKEKPAKKAVLTATAGGKKQLWNTKLAKAASAAAVKRLTGAGAKDVLLALGMESGTIADSGQGMFHLIDPDAGPPQVEFANSDIRGGGRPTQRASCHFIRSRQNPRHADTVTIP